MSTGAAYQAIVPAPFAALGVRVEAGYVVGLDFLPSEIPLRRPADPVAAEAARQLERYLRDPAAGFDLPAAPRGSAFQRRVWRALEGLPAGAVRTYAEIARALGTAPRAVGGACRANPLPIIVPCHRVVATRGGLGGYAGARTGGPVAVKRWLLVHEGGLESPPPRPNR